MTPADPVKPLPAPPPSIDPSPARLTIERIQGLRLAGWAVDPAAPGRERITLHCGDRVLDAAPRRTPRGDVGQALGLAATELGFELDLPPAIWRAMAETGEPLQLQVNGTAVQHPRIQPTLEALHDWMDRVTRLAEPARRDDLLAPLRRHLAPAERWRRGDIPLTDLEDLPAPCHLEGWRGLSLAGWVADRPRRRETIKLRCGDKLLDCPATRVSRKDVAHALLVDDDDIGFEIEIPGHLWRQAGDAEALQFQVVVGHRACGAPQTLRRDELADRLDAALALTDPARRSHQGLLAMEHLVEAGQLDQLDHALRNSLLALALSAGVGDWLGAPAPEQAPDGPQRKPLRLAPRGRLGRWLQDPGRAAQALRLLMALRRRPWLARVAEALELRLTLALGFFDKPLYEEQAPASERGGLPALRHYIRFGDARSMVPMCLFDPRHYTGQLDGRRHPGINRLLHYGLWGRFHGLSPCAWFDIAYYREANEDVRNSQLDPLVHFTTWGWKEHRRPHPDFQPTVAVRRGLMQRLARSRGHGHPDPLVNYLLEGLAPEGPHAERGRLPWMPTTRLDDRDYLDLAPWRTLPQRPAAPVLDVIVPVYAGAQETLRCLWSVLAEPVHLPFELVVIDDCSPEPALSAFLRELAALGLLTLKVNPRNLGFVATVNEGLTVHGDRDVVILNADTRVRAGWLNRLVAHAVSEPRAASITPLSNNATICSYPRTLHSNWERIELDDAGLDALAAQCNAGRHVVAPTGVGFCMWMRRECLDTVGLLDTERFGRGYGEENDWCLRTSAAGWVQLIAADVYVMHQGSVSFRAEADERTRAAIAVLLERHPDYQQRIDRWIANDPLRTARARLDAARLRCQPGTATPLPTVLMVSHARGGGTARHEQEQAQRLLAEQGLGTIFLRPSRLKGHVALAGPAVIDVPNLDALPLRTDGLLVEVLRMLDLREVQLHHLADHAPALRDLLPAICTSLGVPLKITLHDYHMVCPRINLIDASGRYCGEPAPAACDQCLQGDAEGRAAGPITVWRQAHGRLLAQADEVIVPDEDVARRFARYVPALPIQVRPHERAVTLDAVLPGTRPAVRHVLVIGALGLIKGYEVLLALAQSRLGREAGVHFTLLGHSMDDAPLRAAGVTVLGRYDDETLLQRIDELAPDLILLPSVWPETYSYVLTAAMKSGRRIAVFDLGAPARRLRAAKADAIIVPIDLAASPDALAARLLETQAGE